MSKLQQKALKSARYDAKRAAARIADIKQADWTLAEAVLTFATATGLNVTDSDCRVGYHKEIRQTLYVSVESFKDVALQGMLGWALSFLGGGESNDYVTEWSAERDFMFGDNGEKGMCLQLCVRPTSDSKSCRKVQIGEEMKVVATYALRCD
jgi:hypothetical protein